jgi:peptidase M28-like protein
MTHTTTTASAMILAALVACAGDDPGSSGEAEHGSSTAPSTGDSPSTGATLATDGSGSSGAVDSTGDANACTDSPEALADCVEAQRYGDDLEFITGVRDPSSAHWQEVQDLCADRLTEYGYEVQLFDYGTGIDVIGRKPGTTMPQQHVIIGAHYDHIPGCDGADDNATGVAATLEIARVLAMAPTERTVLVACWDEEEDGLLGSLAFVESAVADSLEIATYINFDMIGYYVDSPNTQEVPAGLDAAFPNAYAEVEADEFRGNFAAVITNAAALPTAMDFAAQGDRVGLRSVIIDLPEGTESSELFGDLRRSDHAAFWDAGYASVFVTDTSEFRNPHYHCMDGPDEIADLTEAFSVGIVRATVGAAAIAAGI